MKPTRLYAGGSPPPAQHFEHMRSEETQLEAEDKKLIMKSHFILSALN